MKVIKWLDEHLEEVLMVLLLIAISVLMMANVIARRVFQNSLTWADELSRFLLIWCGFLSVSYCVKKSISIKIDQFQNSLPDRWIPFIKMIRHTIVFVFCVLMIPYCVTFLQQTIASQATSAGFGGQAGVCPIPDGSYLRPDLVVADVIYVPDKTALLELAESVGCKTLNGLGMMLYQGAAAFKLWTGRDMPVEAVKAVL